MSVRRVSVGRDFASWRERARALLRDDVPPADVAWVEAEGGQLTLPDAAGDERVTTRSGFGRAEPPAQLTNVPREFLTLAAAVACHSDARRWSLLYEVLYRLTHGEKHLLRVEVDDAVRACRLMERAVRRDAHKMKAFVRFRAVEDAGGETTYVAWHRPDHHITELMAPWFVRRFGAMRWSILTPDRCAHWDLAQLRFAPGAPRSAAPAEDQIEDLWLSYYASIFNPARLKIKAMKAEMPLKHWPTLPETRLIPGLIRDAAARETTMREAQPTSAAAFIPRPTTAADEQIVPPSLPTLRVAAASCRGCDLYCSATQTVFGEGPADARVVIVGEQPGDSEDVAGRPFVGPAGQLLDRALEEAGLDRRALYVTNAVKHFKFDLFGERRVHRAPGGPEVAACQPWLEAEIDALRPRLIVCLGATATLAVMGKHVKLTENRGIFFQHHRAEAAFLTVHPSFILRVAEPARQRREYERFVADLSAVQQHTSAWSLGWA